MTKKLQENTQPCRLVSAYICGLQPQTDSILPGRPTIFPAPPFTLTLLNYRSTLSPSPKANKMTQICPKFSIVTTGGQ